MKDPDQSSNNNGSLLQRLRIRATEFAATQASDLIEATRMIGRGVSRRVAKTMDEINGEEDGSPIGYLPDILGFENDGKKEKGHPVRRIRSTIKRGAERTIAEAAALAKNLRIISRVNVHTLPALLDDENEDVAFKGEVIDHLISRIAVESPFYEELAIVANRCFDRGIAPDRVVKFFESRQILEMLVDSILNAEHSRYRATDAISTISTSLDSVSLKLKAFAARLNKHPVHGTMESKIRDHFEHFRSTYSPTDPQHTVSAFVRKLEEQYPQYDIRGWVRKNRSLFTALFRGYTPVTDDPLAPKPHHIKNMVYDAYEARGRIFPRQFIETQLSTFFAYKPRDLRPIYIPGVGRQPLLSENSFILDCDELGNFFADALSKIHTREVGPIQLRSMIIDACMAEIVKRGRNAKTIFIREENTVEGIEYESEEDVRERIIQAIQRNTKTLSSHIDITDLLADPERIPEEVEKNYKKFYDESGVLNSRIYNQTLRSMFALVIEDGDEPHSSEAMRKIKQRIIGIFEEADRYLTAAHQALGFPLVLQYETVANANDYAELVRIACTAETKEERFAARRKLELGWLIYSCMYTPRFVFQNRDAGQIKKKLEAPQDGLKVNRAKERRKVYFADSTDGMAKLVDSSESIEMDRLGEQAVVHCIELIPVEFAGVKCHLLPVENGEDRYEYIDKKSLHSMATKLIRKEKSRAKDVTDLVRITFVADSPENLSQIQEYLESHYISFGRNLRRENRYGEFVRVSTFNVGKNPHKSEDYRALRYVVDVPVQDEKGDHMYLAPIEIRILLTEDLAKERSCYNSASHKRYEIDRLRECMRRLTPQAICPQLYKTIPAHPDDIFQRTKTVLRRASDFPLET